ncbi:MAG: ABC transporter ATP-binding protein [Lachnospiraceae bacterium]|nr:ABC transporter ATP-binding protein [Lachnospiraceae bacterium]
MEDVIKVKNLSFSVADKKILEDTSLMVEKGKTVGIIGPNGSGKTTFLKHIYRVLSPQKRTVFIEQRPIEDISFSETARKLAVLKQENAKDFDLSVKDMVLLGRSPYHNYFESYDENDKKIAKKALGQVGMLEAQNQSFGRLSGGEKQRVLMARAIAQDTEILVMDEPTNHLDVHYQWSIMEFIQKMNKTVLGVFHELNLAATFCDYIYVLERGKIIRQGKPKEAITTDLLREVFRVKAEVIDSEGRPYIIFKGTN